MIILYRLLLPIVWILTLPYHAFKRFKRGGYSHHWWQRWGIYSHNLPAKSPHRKRLWVHAVSIGELKSLEPLLQTLKRATSFEIFLTVSTSTAHTLVEKFYASELLGYAWFPWDFYPTMRLAWQHIMPDLALLIESELWPEFLVQASQQKVKVFLLNTRLSDRSYRRYQHIPWLMQWLIRHIHWIASPSEEEALKLQTLGVPTEYIAITGNLKLDRTPLDISQEERCKLRRELGFSPLDSVLLGMSTWPKEEALLLAFLKKIKQEEPSLSVRLCLVPRHIERRKEIVKILQKSTFSWHLRSHGQAPAGTEVILADTSGELEQLAFAGNIAFIGKSFGKNRGGQNPLEAVLAGLPMVYGPHMSNFRAITSALEAEGFAQIVHNPEELYTHLLALLQNSALREHLSKSMASWREKQHGASEKIYQKINEQLKPKN